MLLTSKTKAFTFVELLTIVAISGIFVALLFPTIQAAREASRRMQCSNNIRQLALAVQKYHDTNKILPFVGSWSKSPKYPYPRINSVVLLLPYLEEAELAEKILNGTSVAKSEDKNDAIAVQLAFLKCPSDPVPNMNGQSGANGYKPIASRNYCFCSGDFPDAGIFKYWNETAYGGRSFNNACLTTFMTNNNNTRSGMVTYDTKHRSLDSITDGISNTILWGEMTRGETGSKNIKTSVYRGVVVGFDFSPVGESPVSSCLSQSLRAYDSNYWSGANTIYMFSGVRAYDAIAPYSLFSTILPPNSPMCLASNTDERALLTTSSYHSGGCNIAKYDGSVLFVSNTINAESENLPMEPQVKTSGKSDFGVWGAFGSINGNEKVTL